MINLPARDQEQAGIPALFRKAPARIARAAMDRLRFPVSIRMPVETDRPGAGRTTGFLPDQGVQANMKEFFIRNVL